MFHVPELHRIQHGVLASSVIYGNNGAFLLPSMVDGWLLLCIAADGSRVTVDCPDADAATQAAYADWEHVSVSASNRKRSRTPCWDEMVQIKKLFWDAEDVVMQLHPRASQYVNQHGNVLHLWRSKTREIPEPPAILVGDTAQPITPRESLVDMNDG
jgi:hypothetical protein